MTKEGCFKARSTCTVEQFMSNEPALSGAMWVFTAHGMAKRQDCFVAQKPASYAGTVVSHGKRGNSRLPLAGMYDTESQLQPLVDRQGTSDSATPPAALFLTASVARRRNLYSHARGELCVTSNERVWEAEWS